MRMVVTPVRVFAIHDRPVDGRRASVFREQGKACKLIQPSFWNREQIARGIILSVSDDDNTIGKPVSAAASLFPLPESFPADERQRLARQRCFLYRRKKKLPVRAPPRAGPAA